MYKKFCLILLSLGLVNAVQAQIISGSIKDSKSGQAMERVLVVIMEQKKAAPLASTYTNDKGQFRFDDLKFKGEETTTEEAQRHIRKQMEER